MKILLSPSKTLDESPHPLVGEAKSPAMLEASVQLVNHLKTLSPQDIGKLMGISEKLSKLNYERYQNFHTPFTPENAKQAIFMFKGDVYDGLDAETLSSKSLSRAEDRIRILSGLYGLLHPLDLIQPYRLEMGTKLENPRGKNLYEWWGTHITDALNAEEPKLIINLASNEYFKAIHTKQLSARLVEIAFKERKNGDYKVIGLFAKKARGRMARWLLEQNITTVPDITKFTEDGYRFASDLSSDTILTFVRG